MKKVMATSLAVIMGMSLLTGCGNSSSGSSSEASKKSEAAFRSQQMILMPRAV